MPIVLGIESSCDECSASIVSQSETGLRALSVSTFSQVKIHQPYGGVVPEIASRNHLETINEMIEKASEEAKIPLTAIDAIAVTNRPGLVGALLVGVSAAKALAYALKKPLVPVHHLEGHISSLYLDPIPTEPEIQYPCLVALVSGGHTNLYVLKTHPALWPLDFLKKSIVGTSKDDAAGEAFDKTAKILGFPYPGGMWIDKTSQGGDKNAFSFPRALHQKGNYDFSFSGLKTAVSLTVEKLKKSGELEAKLSDVCASIQEAIVDALVTKAMAAAREHHCQSIAIVGGVAANSRLRSRLSEEKVSVFFPKSKYCTDNAAMIAAAGMFRLNQGHTLRNNDLLTLNAVAYPEL